MVRTTAERGDTVATFTVVQPLALIFKSVRPLAHAVTRPSIVLPLAGVCLDRRRVDVYSVTVFIPDATASLARAADGVRAVSTGLRRRGGEADARQSFRQLTAEQRCAVARVRSTAGVLCLDALGGQEEADATRRRRLGLERLACGDGTGSRVVKLLSVLVGGRRERMRRVQFENASN